MGFGSQCYFVSMMGHFGEAWPIILSNFASQARPKSTAEDSRITSSMVLICSDNIIYLRCPSKWLEAQLARESPKRFGGCWRSALPVLAKVVPPGFEVVTKGPYMVYTTW